MKILVIDGQGGKLGRKLLEEIRKTCPDAVITAVGTNSMATENMMRSNAADRLATGENAVIVNCRNADIIVGPLGIAMADALMGEISPAMANAVASAGAYRVPGGGPGWRVSMKVGWEEQPENKVRMQGGNIP